MCFNMAKRFNVYQHKDLWGSSRILSFLHPFLQKPKQKRAPYGILPSNHLKPAVTFAYIEIIHSWLGWRVGSLWLYMMTDRLDKQSFRPNPASGRQKPPFPGWKLLRVHASLPPVLCETCVNYTWISHVTTGYILSSELGARESQATEEEKNGKALILITGAVN